MRSSREYFKTIEKRALAGENLLSGERKSEPRRLIDLREVRGATTSRGPFNRDVVAAHATDIEITFQRIAANDFTGTLAHLAKRLERANGFHSKFFSEFAPGGSLRILCVIQLSLRNRPGAQIALTPKRPARMDEENANAVVAATVH